MAIVEDDLQERFHKLTRHQRSEALLYLVDKFANAYPLAFSEALRHAEQFIDGCPTCRKMRDRKARGKD